MGNYERKIGFIIPVYNVAEYLSECIESILSQLNEYCELILIDDGSTDESGIICDLYSGLNQVTVIHQRNCGVSIARNVGINKSTADYIAFVDADDRIASHAVDNIINWISNDEHADICLMNANFFYSDGHTRKMCSNDGLLLKGKSRLEALKILSGLTKFPGSACTKVFRRQFIIQNSLLFSADYRNAEDIDFVYKCFMKAKKFDCIYGPYYEYRQERENSASNTITYNKFQSLMEVIKTNAENTRLQLPSKEAVYCLAFLTYEYMILLWESINIDGKYYQTAKKELKDLDWILSYGTGVRNWGIRLSIRVLGYYYTAKLLDWYLNHRNY